MIRWLAPEERETFTAALCFDPLQDARLSTLAACFFSLRAYADFWIQVRKDSVTAALARLGRTAYLSAGPACDVVELTRLLRAVGVDRVETNAAFADLYSGALYSPQMLTALRGPKVHTVWDSEICPVPPLEELFALLSRCDAAFSAAVQPQEWVWELSLRIRRGRGQAVALPSDGRPVSMACILARDEKAALIGSVATLPEYRGRGYAARLLRALCAQESACGRTVYLVTEEERLVRYYESLGFCRQGANYLYTDF